MATLSWAGEAAHEYNPKEVVAHLMQDLVGDGLVKSQRGQFTIKDLLEFHEQVNDALGVTFSKARQ